ncbi:hypothetical protein SDRG_14506 [Saprolegnia diclina VS20]|uniref:Protein kinase domain-containing protein n=1 Tax=Saprolegnia diclina (strain VS20) TaxID=1156394 RepID=T0RDR5_SAPDV|nr:hypothetical protein SDRG_14506 [Saprolegnia diclina VS20]EQC27757.1 hypothetical protein SDRG_14506 [Saprolegnia diclina VS20]|eukprot:XP_008618862.1 hypothetical protein SDRG_14506 [Saprolegnia diclina VS20]
MLRWLLLPAAASALLTQDPGTTAVTQTVGENLTLTLSCPDASTAINKILFASYGMPKGDGLAASAESYCDSPKSKPVVQSYCLQQQACSLWAVNSWFTDECVGTAKHLTVTAQCAAATPTLALDSGAMLAAANVTENSTLSLACADTSATISKILFASYGLPSNVGLYAAQGKCDAANSTAIVAAACLGKTACSVSADNSVFGNPCASIRKHLTVTAQCTSSNKSSSSTALIVGIGCGVAVLMAVVGGYVCCSRRRKEPLETRPDTPVYQILESTTNRADPKPRTRNSSVATGPTGPTSGPNDASQHHKTYPESFVGASWTRPIEIECVVEYMDLGDLRNYLMTTRPGVLTWSQKYDVILSVIHGLVYLHTFKVPIIHRDLKSRNILLDSVKVCYKLAILLQPNPMVVRVPSSRTLARRAPPRPTTR